MATQLFPLARQQFATAGRDWTAGTYRAVLLASTFTIDFSTHVYLSDIPTAQRVRISDPITSRTATNGYCSGSTAYFPLVLDVRAVSKAIIYEDTGVENTSVLVAALDEDTLVEAPFVPRGFDYYIYPNTLEGGYFRV